MLTLPLEQMTVKEKLQVMEELWSDLQRGTGLNLGVSFGERLGIKS